MRQRKLMLPPFHGDRLRGYADTMRAVTEEAIESWPLGEPLATRPLMQSLTLEIIMRTVFGVQDEERKGRLGVALSELLRWGGDPRRMSLGLALGPQARRQPRALAEGARAGRHRHLRGDRRPPRGGRARSARRRDVAPAPGAPRGRQRSDVRPRAPRRADDAAGRGSRDHGHRPGLGARAARPPSGRARAAARGRRRVRGRGRQGDASPAAADLDRPAPSPEAHGDRRAAAPGRRESGALHLPDAPPGATSTRIRSPSAPSGFSRARAARTPGSRSGAACVAAWAPASPSSRCASRCRRLRVGSTYAPPIRAPSEWCGARSSSRRRARARSWPPLAPRPGPALPPSPRERSPGSTRKERQAHTRARARRGLGSTSFRRRPRGPSALARLLDSSARQAPGSTVVIDWEGRIEPPPAGDELATLLGFLEFQRSTFAWKCFGPDPLGMQSTVGVSTMTLGGLLKHMAIVEDWWFSCSLNGNEYDAAWIDVDWQDHPDWDWETAVTNTPGELATMWHERVRRSRELTAVALARDGLDTLGRATERLRHAQPSVDPHAHDRGVRVAQRSRRLDPRDGRRGDW